MSKNYITPEGFKKLRSEYQHLSQVERPKVVETVAWAASNGDRSENADYIYGKRRLREIDSKMRFLQKRLESAEVVDPQRSKSDKIAFGCRVTLENEEGEIKRIRIVGEDEINPSQGEISWKAPLAMALMGKKSGDEISLKLPKGDEFFTVLKIEYS